MQTLIAVRNSLESIPGVEKKIELSMRMVDDLEFAVRRGLTSVRVGKEIFPSKLKKSDLEK